MLRNCLGFAIVLWFAGNCGLASGQHVADRISYLVDLPQAKSEEARPPFDPTDSCRDCHSNKSRTGFYDFVDTIPGAVWDESDKHHDAFRLLLGHPTDPKKSAEKNERVRRILGFDIFDVLNHNADKHSVFSKEFSASLKVVDAEPEAKRAELAKNLAVVKACLRCHATLPADQTEPPVDIHLGVSCQACHGPGSEWNLTHQSVAWRLVKPAHKEAMGFADVRDPTKKAQLCMSCHVGDVEQGKFVIHEWYAGGHPPLPSFELSSFVAAMPIHWRPLNEKKLDFIGRSAPPPAANATLISNGKKLIDVKLKVWAGNLPNPYAETYISANFPDKNGEQIALSLPRARDSAIGGVVAAATYAKLVRDYGVAVESRKAPGIEFSLFECSACHHELSSQSGFQQRPSRTNIPGRPPAFLWPFSTFEITKSADSPTQAAVDAVAILNASLTAQPFGDLPRAKEAGKVAHEKLMEIAGKLNATVFDLPTSVAMRDHLLAQGDDVRDFESARVRAWMVRQILKDTVARRPTYGYDADDANRGISKGLDDIFTPEGKDPLTLMLPSGQQNSIIDSLSGSLSASRQYRAKAYAELLEAIRKRVQSN
jgi:hypothetical protein